MKSLIAVLVLAASPAFAYFDDGANEPTVQYLSWCDGNSVVTQDGKGQPVTRFTCNEDQTCQTMSRYKIDRIIVIGTCVDNNK